MLIFMQNIPHWFVKKHRMWQYHNALLKYDQGLEFYVDVELQHHTDKPNSKNHVTIKGGWKNIVKECYWEPNKMVRFKLIDIVKDESVSLPSRKPVEIPIFHMC